MMCVRELKFAGWVTALLLACAALTGCASQRDVYSLDDRLTALEQRYLQAEQDRRELKNLVAEFRQRRDNSDQSLRNQSAELSTEIQNLREDIQRLQGQIEQGDHALQVRIENLEGREQKLQEQQTRWQQAAEENRTRLGRLEQYLNFDQPVKAAPDAGGGGAAGALSEEQLYSQAKSAFDQGDLEKAAKGFQELLKRFSKSSQADNAQFWLGEIYFREKWYEKAILEYQKVIENYPKGNKVPSALLKQGLAFSELGDRANARLILKELIGKYPQSNESAVARKKLEEL